MGGEGVTVLSALSPLFSLFFTLVCRGLKGFPLTTISLVDEIDLGRRLLEATEFAHPKLSADKPRLTASEV